MTPSQPGNPRVRLGDLGVPSGMFARGTLNAITDVPGIRIGHASLHDDGLNTGVTAIVPDALDGRRRSLPAGLSVGNGYGKLVGATQLQELGALETPILLTSTLSVFRVADAFLGHLLATPAHAETTTLNPVVGETNDGFLSDIRRRAVGAAQVDHALRSAATGPVAEGCVGAGAGTVALGYKGGIGTASRVLHVGGTRRTVGAIVQTNFSGTLRIAGVPLPAEELLAQDPAAPVGNSCMIVVATDAAVDGRQLGRVANRAVFAMRGVGADYAQGSGDYAIAFSVHDPADGGPVAEEALSPLFAATMDAVEEALVNSVLTAQTTEGPEGRIAHAIPIDVVRTRLAAAGVI
ncbi:P1 family peptidase [Microbacterium sp. MYb62]|uniref:P1 family peptidase n=1 Tax=Microbacterium sp. MYb62 TaxID=1848690 RepID=UPI000CFB15DF|nr:P1 family peptidase [Microbacterium sp. MYb62]PRB12195.1 aminopeptidase [Microbacterium sp. MYb62]